MKRKEKGSRSREEASHTTALPRVSASPLGALTADGGAPDGQKRPSAQLVGAAQKPVASTPQLLQMLMALMLMAATSGNSPTFRRGQPPLWIGKGNPMKPNESVPGKEAQKVVFFQDLRAKG